MTPAIVGSCLGGVLRLFFRGSLPKVDGTFTADDLNEPGAARISRDKFGIAHVTAATDHDVFFLNGVVHAQDRLWQMHGARRLAAGRLSEFAGAKALDLDRLSRQLGFRRLAEGDLEALRSCADPDAAMALDACEAFAAGVNWVVGSMQRMPVEFKLTGAKWDTWTAVDSLALGRLYGFVMNFGFQHALLRQGLIELFGPEKAAAWTNTSEEEDSIPHTVSEATWKAFQAANLSGAFSAGLNAMPRGQGSNWWVVHGSLTSTGKPLLAGDPHLTNKVPGFWYEMHLRQTRPPPSGGPSIDAYGAAPPGVPGILIGHNSFLAVSITLAFCDVEDVFLERVRKSDGKYLHRGEWKDCQVVEETIEVKGQESVVVNCRSTCHGAILDSVFSYEPFKRAAAEKQGVGDDEEVHIAYAGIPLRPKSLATLGIIKIFRARSFAEFDHAVSFVSRTYSLNLGYADSDGHIGYILLGEVPIRGGEHGDEMLPLPGWTGQHDWAGFVPHSELPKGYDPPDGMIIAANHKLLDYRYYEKYYLGKAWKSGYRAKSIELELKSRLKLSKLTVADMAEVQMDVKSWAAVDFVDEVRSVAPEADTADALAMLTGWDGQLSMDSVAASLYQLVHAELVQLLLEKGFRALGLPSESGAFAGLDRASVAKMVNGGSFDPSEMLKMINEFQGHLHINVIRLLRSAGPDAAPGPATTGRRWWLDQAGGRDAAVNAAVRAACAQLRTLAGAGWQTSPAAAWGKVHTAHFVHPVTARLGLPRGSPPFDCPSCEMGGDTNTTAQASTKSLTDLTATASGVSLRVIFSLADLRDPEANRIVHPLGQSGQFNSPHYCDQTALWKEGDFRGVVTEPAAIQEAAVATMRFAACDHQGSSPLLEERRGGLKRD